MTRAVAAMAGNHVAANLLMLFLVLGGLYAAGTLRQDIFPDTRPERVNVVVEYPGATPAEVEDAIVLPIELAVAEVDHVRRIRSSARESLGSVSLELINESDVDVALEEVKNAVDRIRTFPEEAERPEIMRVSRRREAMSVYVYGETTERALLETAESVRDDLIAFPEITAVQLSGHRPYEISIEIHEDDLRRYDLTLPEVAEIVREASLDLGGGTIRAEGGDVLVRTTEKRYTGADYANVPVFRKPSGETVLLGEIGQVIDGFAPTDQRFLYDGWPAVLVQVYQIGQQKPGDIAGRADGQSALLHSAVLVGGILDDDVENGEGSNLAQVTFFLAPSGRRGFSALDFANAWRDRVTHLAGVDRVEFSAETEDAEPDIAIELAHPDFGALTAATERLKRALASYVGVSEVVDSHTEGKRELRLRLRAEAGALGITETDLAVQVRSAFYGAEALRITRGHSELKVMVRYPDAVRRTLSATDGIMLRTPDGHEIPFREAAHVEEGRGFSEIVRTDRRRVISVSAMVDESLGNTNEILRGVTNGELRTLLEQYQGLSYALEGETREEQEAVNELAVALGGGLLAIYSLLAVAFRSYLHPFIIMSAIPFGIVGALVGHLPFGLPISLLSLFGIVAMAGVAVNDSLVLIDCTNQLRAAGRSAFEAAAEAARRRFRPVVITSLTTFCGLMPIALEQSEPAQFLIPLAVSLAFGVLASTPITLVLVPSLYLIVEDLLP